MPKPSWGGALGGAATGAGLGSVFGPIGMGIGGLLGGVGGLFGAGRSKEEKFQQRSTLSPEQAKNLSPLNQLLPGLNEESLSILQQLLNYQPESMEEMQQPALNQFEQEIIPSILERFSGLGARSSSALNQTLGQAAQGLGTNLAAMRSNAMQNATGVRQNALQQLLGYNQFAASPQFTQNYVQGRQPGLFEQLAPAAGQLFSSTRGGGLF